MSDPVTRLNAALEGRYAIEREITGVTVSFALSFDGSEAQNRLKNRRKFTEEI